LNELPTPTEVQRQRAEWDRLLLDIEARTAELRQLKAYEPRRIIIQTITAASVLLAAGAALGALLLRALS
jgi:hypothetical protein